MKFLAVGNAIDGKLIELYHDSCFEKSGISQLLPFNLLKNG
jgi:hypothetical protein